VVCDKSFIHVFWILLMVRMFRIQKFSFCCKMDITEYQSNASDRYFYTEKIHMFYTGSIFVVFITCFSGVIFSQKGCSYNCYWKLKCDVYSCCSLLGLLFVDVFQIFNNNLIHVILCKTCICWHFCWYRPIWYMYRVCQ